MFYVLIVADVAAALASMYAELSLLLPGHIYYVFVLIHIVKIPEKYAVLIRPFE
jgi:hypothetical protein